MSKQVYLVTGGGSGFGARAARALALEQHIVYATLRKANPGAEANAATFSRENNCQLRTIVMDLTDQAVVDAGVKQILAEAGQIDVVVHNAGHMNFGAAESFTAEQVLHLLDVNAVGMHRLNLAILPHFRSRKRGHLIVVSSSSLFGGRTTMLGAYFAAKAAMEVLGQVYSRELNAWGIETTILTPGVFGGTDHFKNAMQPGRPEIVDEYEAGPTAGLAKSTMDGTMNVLPEGDAGDPKLVADALVSISRIPRGDKPFRVYVDPVGDGSEKAGAGVDANGNAFMKRIGLENYLKVWV